MCALSWQCTDDALMQTVEGIPPSGELPQPDKQKPVLARWLGRGVETHITLPFVALVLLCAIWVATFHFIGIEQVRFEALAQESARELMDTYEARMVRNLSGIDQTLKMLKYAFNVHGAAGAIQSLDQQLLLPSGLVFVIRIADRNGVVVASNPLTPSISVANDGFFQFHRDNDKNIPFVSAPQYDAASAETHLSFTRRLNNAAGKFDGVAILMVNPAYFTSGYERARQGEYGVLALVGSDNLIRTMRVGDTQSWGQPVPPTFIGSIKPGAPTTSPWDQVPRFTRARQLHGFPLTAVVALAESEQMVPFRTQRSQYLWLVGSGSAVLVLLVALICAWSWQLTKSRRRNRRDQATYAAASEANLDAFFVLRSVLDSAGLVVDFVIDAANSRAKKMTGMPGQSLIGIHLSAIAQDYWHNGIFSDVAKVAMGGGVHEAEWEDTRNPERQKWLHRQVVAVEGGVVAIVRDISARKQAEQRILHMAHHDSLTGLANRLLINNRLERAMLQAQRRGRCIAVAFIDLDKFKLINDGLGHDAGDLLLTKIGERLRQCVRREDTVGRFGGDEFVILLEDQGEDPSAIIPALEKIQCAVTEPVLICGRQVQVNCSMGVAMYPRNGTTAGTLIKNADAAMYRAKEKGSNNFQFYAPEMNARVQEKLAMVEDLRCAIESTAGKFGGSSQFRLVYQPKVDLRSGLILGVEALLRWHCPNRGVVSPLEFIPMAEESGLIIALGEWVLQTACMQSRAWQDAGLTAVTMAVNVSPRQFEENQLVRRIARALQESRLAPGLLELEITESLIMRDVQQAVSKMHEIAAMNVSFSIDDFGTGYSSLFALKSFPICSLKIDKSFVNELASNPDDQAIASAIIMLGHKLNLRVIAEGVETEPQLQFLRDHDCDEMQGYLFSRPVAPEQIALMLAAQAQQQLLLA